MKKTLDNFSKLEKLNLSEVKGGAATGYRTTYTTYRTGTTPAGSPTAWYDNDPDFVTDESGPGPVTTYPGGF